MSNGPPKSLFPKPQSRPTQQNIYFLSNITLPNTPEIP